MQEKLFFVYYLLFVLGLATGIVRYRALDGAMRVVVVLLFFTSITELATYVLLKKEFYLAKSTLFHIWSVIELIIISQYFIRLNKPRHHVLLTALASVLWPTAGGLNILFFQPLGSLNTNMLMLESFIIITFCLYSILLQLRRKVTGNIFYESHFWICILWVVFWSSTFFFWAFIKILYKEGWAYRDTVLTLQAVVNLVVYSGIATVLLLYPKMKNIENN